MAKKIIRSSSISSKTSTSSAQNPKPIQSLTIAISGANQVSIENHVGRPVGEVCDALRQVLNIAGGATALINGKPVENNRIIQQGEQLEFVKESGSKG